MKKLSFFLAILLMITLLAGCAAKTDAPANEAPTEAPTEAPAASGPFVLCNGVELRLGDKFADVKDALGAETAPADDILPCDGSDLYHDILHHYADLEVTENKDGVIKEIDAADGSAALFMGKVKLGMTQSEAVELLGEPNNWPLPEDDFALNYSADNVWAMLYLDPDTNKEIVYSFTLILME